MKYLLWILLLCSCASDATNKNRIIYPIYDYGCWDEAGNEFDYKKINDSIVFVILNHDEWWIEKTSTNIK